MKIAYRIYTEDINRSLIRTICELAAVQSYTLIPCKGVFEGTSENSLIIEVIGDAALGSTVRYIALEIKRWNNQQCVLVAQQTVHVETV